MGLFSIPRCCGSGRSRTYSAWGAWFTVKGSHRGATLPFSNLHSSNVYLTSVFIILTSYNVLPIRPLTYEGFSPLPLPQTSVRICRAGEIRTHESSGCKPDVLNHWTTALDCPNMSKISMLFSNNSIILKYCILEKSFLKIFCGARGIRTPNFCVTGRYVSSYTTHSLFLDVSIV